MQDRGGTTPGARLSSVVVALLFFAPLLALAWWGINLTIAWNGETEWQIPAQMLLAAIAFAAMLGWFAPRASAAIFGWLSENLWRFARFWWP
jgi:hypothetical protein